MRNLIVKNVDVFGDTIVAAQDAEGNIWAGVKWFCEGLGLTEGTPQNLCKNSGCERPEIQSGGFFLQYWKAALPGLRRNRADQSGCTVSVSYTHLE